MAQADTSGPRPSMERGRLLTIGLVDELGGLEMKRIAEQPKIW